MEQTSNQKTKRKETKSKQKGEQNRPVQKQTQ